MYYLLLLPIFFVSSRSRVITPCGLALELDAHRNSSFTLIPYADFPLVVCIAGYRNYNTSHRLLYSNSTGYYGIFGVLHPTDSSRCWISGIGDSWQRVTTGELLRDDLQADLRCMKNVLLQDPMVRDFYDVLCGPTMVRKIKCKLAMYRFVEVWDPIHKDIFDKEFIEHGGSNSLIDLAETLTRSTTLKTPTINPKLMDFKIPENRGAQTTESKTQISHFSTATESSPAADEFQGPSTSKIAKPESSHDAGSTIMIVIAISIVQLLIVGAVLFYVVKFVNIKRSTDPQVISLSNTTSKDLSHEK